MIAKRHLSHAPIREAVIDFRATFEASPKLSEELSNSIGQRIGYPTRNVIHRHQWGFEQTPDRIAHTRVDQGIVSLRFTSEDGKYIAQFKVDGFSLSRLEPYETWESFEEEAMRLLMVYNEELKPQMLTRVSTRFVNLISLRIDGQNMTDLLDYFVAPPTLPEPLRYPIGSFLSRIVFQNHEINATGILTHALESITDAKEAPIVLDIDVFKEIEGMPTEDWCRDNLRQLRDFKNELFFESVTAQTVERYQ